MKLYVTTQPNAQAIHTKRIQKINPINIAFFLTDFWMICKRLQGNINVYIIKLSTMNNRNIGVSRKKSHKRRWPDTIAPSNNKRSKSICNMCMSFNFFWHRHFPIMFSMNIHHLGESYKSAHDTRRE